MKLTCTRQLPQHQPHLVQHLPGQKRSLHLQAPHSTSVFPTAPPLDCTLQSKMDIWSPPKQHQCSKLSLKVEVCSTPYSLEGFQEQRQSLCSPLRNCTQTALLYPLKIQTIYLYLKRSYDLLGGSSVLTNNLVVDLENENICLGKPDYMLSIKPRSFFKQHTTSLFYQRLHLWRSQ